MTKKAAIPTVRRALCRTSPDASSPLALYSTTIPNAATASSVTSSGTSTIRFLSSGVPSVLRVLAPHSTLPSDIERLRGFPAQCDADGAPRGGRDLGRGPRRAAFDLVEPGIEDFARDRRRGAAAPAAVLDDDRDRNARIFGRGERDEEPVVPEPLVDFVLVVFLFLRD